MALHPHPHQQMTVRDARYPNLKTIQRGQEIQQRFRSAKGKSDSVLLVALKVII